MSIPSLPPCDVVIAPNRAVYINGTLITNVMDFQMSTDATNPLPEVTLMFTPTSVVFGEIPKDTLEAANFDMHPDDGTVNISRAIARAQARAAGLDPLRHVQPAPTPAAAPPPVRKVAEKKDVAEEAYPVDEDYCGQQLEGEASYVKCKKPYGHAGGHSRYKGKT